MARAVRCAVLLPALLLLLLAGCLASSADLGATLVVRDEEAVDVCRALASSYCERAATCVPGFSQETCEDGFPLGGDCSEAHALRFRHKLTVQACQERIENASCQLFVRAFRRHRSVAFGCPSSISFERD